MNWEVTPTQFLENNNFKNILFQLLGVTDAEDGVRRKRMIRCDDPWREKLKEHFLQAFHDNTSSKCIRKDVRREL